jgi:hypothetical protein
MTKGSNGVQVAKTMGMVFLLDGWDLEHRFEPSSNDNFSAELKNGSLTRIRTFPSLLLLCHPIPNPLHSVASC